MTLYGDYLYAELIRTMEPEPDADELYETHRELESEAAAEGPKRGRQPRSQPRDAGPDGGVDGRDSPAAVRSSAGGRS